MITPIEQRFLKYVDRSSNECWLYIGARHGQGYGLFRDDGKLWRAHRFAYEMWIGPIPNGMQVLHQCDNPPCCNPTHLFLGTNSDNVQDAIEKGRHNGGKTHCPEGHPYSGDNLYVRPNGVRECRMCQRQHDAGRKR